MSDRLTAPREHLGVLVEPDAAALHATLRAGPAHALRGVPILNSSVAELRARLRRRLELSEPVIVTGHQPEFCHAGVFAKTVAAHTLAAERAGTGVFLTVDFDLPKAVRLPVPYLERSTVKRAFVPIPGCDPYLPIEWQPPVPATLWREFFDRVAETSGRTGDTLLPAYTDGVFADQPATLDFSDAVARGQGAVTRLLELPGLIEVRASRLSQTPEFRAFVAHLLLNAAGFAEHYNAAQRAYRAKHRERNPRRPAPPLATDGQRVESPFWVCRMRRPRQRLFVAARSDCVELFAGDEPIGTEPRSGLLSAGDCRRPLHVEQSGWHLRPRALTLSAFTRLFLSDLFVHGIGGARYDEMTEDFVRRFFDAELPAACCVTATAHLPLPCYGVDHQALAAARHARRDLRFNPQRHLRDVPRDLLDRRRTSIAESDRLRRKEPRAHAARRHAFNAIRAVNHELLRHDPDRSAELQRQWRLLEQRWRSDRAALDREYFFALHPRRTMKALIERIRAALDGNPKSVN